MENLIFINVILLTISIFIFWSSIDKYNKYIDLKKSISKPCIIYKTASRVILKSKLLFSDCLYTEDNEELIKQKIFEQLAKEFANILKENSNLIDIKITKRNYHNTNSSESDIKCVEASISICLLDSET